MGVRWGNPLWRMARRGRCCATAVPIPKCASAPPSRSRRLILSPVAHRREATPNTLSESRTAKVRPVCVVGEGARSVSGRAGQHARCELMHQSNRASEANYFVGAGEERGRDREPERVLVLRLMVSRGIAVGGRQVGHDCADCKPPDRVAQLLQAIRLAGVPALNSQTTGHAIQPPETPRVTRCPILVHGTWGRGFLLKSRDEGSWEDVPSEGTKRWFEKGSEFRKNLEAELNSSSLEYSIRPFHWSGANSVLARDRAAMKIGRHAQNAPAKPKRYAHCHRPQSRGKRGTARLEPFGRYQPRQGWLPWQRRSSGYSCGIHQNSTFLSGYCCGWQSWS